jgi:hypothetical protein
VQKQGVSPLVVYRDDPLLFLLTLCAAAASIAALLLQLARVVRMPYTLSFVTAPGMVFLLALLVWRGRVGRSLVLGRLRAGFLAGLVGLVFYNVTRWFVGFLLSVKVSPFYSIYIFGSLITGKPGESLAAGVAGWLYHISNGVTFAIMYTLVAGPARWWYGLLWGLVLEAAMLLIYPSSSILRPPALAPFVVVSLASHAMYGAAIGVISRRFTGPRGAQ